MQLACNYNKSCFRYNL